ncbi:MAG TPA: trypsin-like peptidase domain-containing protein [Sphingomicrobium sp.]|nr:trypsin-like peptidase domain-containing protein [Sphingomicrobium sp.]
MADPRAARPRLPIFLLFLLIAVSAFVGGIVARLIPANQPDPGPRILAGPADDSLAPLVRKTSPAVVNIAVLQPSPAEQNPLLQDPFFRRYFGVPDTALQPAMAAGSGVIVDGAKGFVITNFHVVRDAQAIEVTLKDGRKYRAEPLGVAPNLDLAVLHIDAKNLPTLALGDSRKIEVGDYVVAIGNPFGLGQTVTSGIVSATERPLGQGDSRRFIQTDAPINPGNSGGALINLHGELVGINSALFSPTSSESSAGNVGIGFAIPSNVVKQVITSAERQAPRQ